MSMKLTSWKANHLSFAGRVTLAKSVMEVIPIYPMMTTIIPKACIEENQRMQRRFIWGDTDQARRYHAVGWHILSKPKTSGGLGLRRLDVMNKACILKFGRKLQTGLKELWCEVLWGKYRRTAEQDGVTARSTDSRLFDPNAMVFKKNSQYTTL
ncbi:RNA-directed DNA polymerase (Reverse transcriptase) [Trifolium medium]|uniref:RNA-directed DNA polymerase (Reverse transcriptase) n=1 Tax=Trifolium medium TaxID=97028 RepID=A0A392N2C5_9FABA|nr:RNA-directed DNA polymerase (Reverse transcriptase) [Trifolium medium]